MIHPYVFTRALGGRRTLPSHTYDTPMPPHIREHTASTQRIPMHASRLRVLMSIYPLRGTLLSEKKVWKILDKADVKHYLCRRSSTHKIFHTWQLPTTPPLTAQTQGASSPVLSARRPTKPASRPSSRRAHPRAHPSVRQAWSHGSLCPRRRRTCSEPP